MTYLKKKKNHIHLEVKMKDYTTIHKVALVCRKAKMVKTRFSPIEFRLNKHFFQHPPFKTKLWHTWRQARNLHILKKKKKRNRTQWPTITYNVHTLRIGNNKRCSLTLAGNCSVAQACWKHTEISFFWQYLELKLVFGFTNLSLKEICNLCCHRSPRYGNH